MSEDDFKLDARQIRLVLPHRPPILMLQQVDRCAVTLDRLEATLCADADHPMLMPEQGCLAPVALIEALAQCSGLLMRLRWLAARGVDLAAFAGGGPQLFVSREIPRTALAESHAHFHGIVPPGQTLQLTTRLVRSHGAIHRFDAAATAAAPAVSAQIVVAFPHAG